MDRVSDNLLANLMQLLELQRMHEGSNEDVHRLESTSSGSSSVSRSPACLQPSMSGTRGMQCNFCKQNGETSGVFTSHNLRDGKRITCPFLRRHVCELCGATGDDAHTRSYCLVAAAQRSLRSGDPSGFLYHNSAVLKRTGRNSSGKTGQRFPGR